MEEERYELFFDELINDGGKENLRGIVFDVCPKGCKPLTEKKMSVVFMSDDKGVDKKGNEIGHSPYGVFYFEEGDNFDLAKMALELLQQAIHREVDLKEEKRVKKK